MKKRVVAVLLSATIVATLASGCADSAKGGDIKKNTTETKTEESEELGKKETSKTTDKKIEVDSATEEEVLAFMNDSDEKTVLVDARPQENYSGWALEGAKNGGH